MLRKDGKVKIYQIVTREREEGYKDGEWFVCSTDRFLIKVPNGRKYRSEKHRMDGRMREPFASFSASGKCWQATGHLGAFKQKTANKMAELLSKYNPGRDFGVQEARLSQKTRIMGYHRT